MVRTFAHRLADSSRSRSQFHYERFKQAMTKSETQLTLRKEIAGILHEPEGEGALLVTSLEMAELMDKEKLDQLEALFTQALTSLTGLACDKCRVRMEDFNGKGK